MALVSTMSEKWTRCYRRARECRARLWLIVLLVTVCGSVIVYCRLGLQVSIVSTHFAYLPIVLTGMWWGRRGICVAAFFGALIVCLNPLAPTGEPLVADFGRAFFFVLVGVSVAAISERAEAALKAEETSRRELEGTQQRLVSAERMASMGQLSAGAAHEINNPLGTVLLYSYSLLNQLQSDDPRRDDLRMVVNEATRCKDIVRGLLDFARQSRASKAPTDPAALIEEAALIAAPRAEEAGIRLTSDVPDNLPTMMVDGMQIRQMLVNLIQNGIDAAAEGGNVRVAVRLCPSAETVEIKVSDDGCGIPKENLPKLFTPFFSTKQPGKGTGLGLAITYGVVKMHSGDITVESREGEGTTFSVRLPLQSEHEGGSPGSADDDDQRNGVKG